MIFQSTALSNSPYKNVHVRDKKPLRLYNIKDDPHEKNDLSAVHPEIVEELRKKTAAWHPTGGN
jgi:hypothetical protein